VKTTLLNWFDGISISSIPQRCVAGGDHRFAEVTQADCRFGIKTGSRRSLSLAGWLLPSAHYTAAKVVRGEQRRWARGGGLPNATSPCELNDEVDWGDFSVIDRRCMCSGSGSRCDCSVTERKPFLQIGARLGLNENAARMRAGRWISCAGFSLRAG
jgi:hypothetical protein